MSKSMDPLKKTDAELHRVWVLLEEVQQWYNIMKELRANFGKNWHTQPKTRKRLRRYAENKLFFSYYVKTKQFDQLGEPVWFDVPDTKIFTWLSIKYGIPVITNKK